jgi:hypothetical protein
MAEKNRAGSKPPVVTDDGKDENLEAAEVVREGKTPADDIIADLKEQAKLLDVTANATLYKYDHPTSGTSRIHAGYFTGDEIINVHQIGTRYGSGRYGYIVKRPAHGKTPEEQKFFTIRIHPIYDELKKKADAEAAAQQNSGALVPAGRPVYPSPQENFTIVKDILSLLLPVIKASQQQQTIQPAAAAPDPFQSYAMMQKVLKSNLYDTAATYRDMARRFSQLPPAGEEDGEFTEEGEEENDGKEKGLMEKIIDMVEPFFNLIAQKGAAGKLAAAGLKAAPAFADVLKDKNLCRMIINYFDKTRGKPLADIALKNIGIERGQFFSQIPAAAAPAARAATQPARPAAGKAGK